MPPVKPVLNRAMKTSGILHTGETDRLPRYHRQGMKITWLASYPRSGNTWARFLLLTWLYGRQPSTAKLQTLIPDVHDGPDERLLQGREHVIVKSHYRCSENMKLREKTAGVIYIVRHPMDVLVSNMNYVLLNIEVDFADRDRISEEEFRNKFIGEYLRLGGLRDWMDRGIGTWSEHAISWLQLPLAFPTLVLRYEDMLDDLPAAAGKMGRFLQGLGWDLPRLADESARLEAIESAQFQSMREFEEREFEQEQPGFFYHAHRSDSFRQGRRFINQGRKGQGRALLSDEQYERAKTLFGPVMKQFGYD